MSISIAELHVDYTNLAKSGVNTKWFLQNSEDHSGSVNITQDQADTLIHYLGDTTDTS